MKHQEGFFTDEHGWRIFCQQWLPEGEPRAVLIVVHGLAEHCGRYTNLVNQFVPRGMAVYAHDHLGHGRSDGRRVYVSRFADFTDVLGRQVDRVRERHPKTPMFLVAHSLGALIGTTFLLERQDAFAGAVLSGSLVKVPDHISPIAVLMSRLLSAVIPTAGIVAVDPKSVSRDPAVVAAYLDDPLVYNGRTTARLGCEMLRAMQRVTAEASRITLPLLILHGGEDRLVDVAGAHMLQTKAGSLDKTLTIYDGLHHEVYNEPEHARVLADVEAWISARS